MVYSNIIHVLNRGKTRPKLNLQDKVIGFLFPHILQDLFFTLFLFLLFTFYIHVIEPCLCSFNFAFLAKHYKTLTTTTFTRKITEINNTESGSLFAL